MGLFSSISRFVEKVAGTAGSLISTVATAVTPLARIAAPLVGQFAAVCSRNVARAQSARLRCSTDGHRSE